MAQLPLDQTFILSIWVEAILYGLYFSLFCTCLYVVLDTTHFFRTVSSRIMFVTMLLTFFLATVHVAINLYRLLRGYVWLRDAPGGPVAYFGNLARWDHVFKDTIFVTQSLIGDALSVYRCWLVWEGNYYVVALPLVLLVCNTFSGYIVCYLFTTVPNAAIFSPRLNHWITTFFSVALTQNIITTSLIAYHIWRSGQTAAYLNPRSRAKVVLMVRIVVESAAIYVLAELLLLILYVSDKNAQYIVLETITSIVGIAYTSITIRLALLHTKPRDESYKANDTNTPPGIINVPMHPMTVHIERAFQDDLVSETGIHVDQQTYLKDKS